MVRTVASVVIRAIIGVAFGYWVYVLTRSSPVEFFEWLTVSSLAAVNWIVWAVIGGGIAAALSSHSS